MKKLNSKFYCIQPIQIEVDSLSKLFGTKLNLSKINTTIISDVNQHPKWKKIMDELYNLYSSIVLLNFKMFDVNSLKSELNNTNFLINGKVDISEYLNEDNTDVYLFFDYRLMQFIVIYEIAFDFPINILEDITSTDEKKLDYYNSVRNIYVKETDNSIVLPHILNLKSNIVNFIRTYIKDNFSLNIPLSHLQIPNNSGNITNVVTMEEFDENEYTKYSEVFMKLNSFAERVPNNNTPIQLNGHIDNNNDIDYNKELYYFNGRFHTITLHSKKNQYRFIPIQFQMQYLWFYLSKQINLVLEKYNDNILNDDSISKVTEYSDKIDLIINKVEILNIFNQKFKLSIEADSQIYYLIENRWNIEDMIKGSNEYIKFFKDYLSRLYTKKTSKIEQRQNKILLFITLFQFIALLSVWNDYLSLLDDDLKKKADEILPLFGGYSNLELFNYYLPIGFLIVIAMMVYYIYRNKE